MGTAVQPAPRVDIEHLKLIEGVINRLAQNSFQAKSWSVALVAAILGFTGRSTQGSACLLALLPAFCFWLLDAFYLRQERLFRRLYAAAADGKVPAFSMDTSPYDANVASWASTLFTPAVFLVHVIILVVIGIVISVFALA